MTNLEKLLAYVNDATVEHTPYGIEFFNQKLSISFDAMRKMWTGQILNDSGIAINGAGIDFDFSAPDMNTVIDNLILTYEADFL